MAKRTLFSAQSIQSGARAAAQRHHKGRDEAHLPESELPVRGPDLAAVPDFPVPCRARQASNDCVQRRGFQPASRSKAQTGIRKVDRSGDARIFGAPACCRRLSEEGGGIRKNARLHGLAVCPRTTRSPPPVSGRCVKMCCQEELVLRTRRAIDALSYTRPATLSLKKLESAARWRLHLGGW